MSPLRLLAIERVLGNVGDQMVIEADFASLAGIESTLSIEKGCP